MRILVLLLLLVGWVPAGAQTLSVEAPPSLAWAAARVEAVDRDQLAEALSRAGLELPSEVRVTLLAEDDPTSGRVPPWVVGVALAPRDVLILPERTSRYPYDSLESIVRHEVAHLALAARAGGEPLPRWFHEGVAVSVEAGWGLTGQVRLLGAIASQPAIGDLGRLFEAGTEPDSVRAYLLATALVDDLRRRHGAEVVGAVAGGVAQGLSFDRAFTLETGESVASATARAWGTYLRWTRWVLLLVSPSSMWTVILALAVMAFAVQRRRRARRRRQWDEEDAVVVEKASSPTIH